MRYCIILSLEVSESILAKKIKEKLIKMAACNQRE